MIATFAPGAIRGNGGDRAEAAKRVERELSPLA